MLSPLKKPESMYDIIFEAVTKKREAVQETAKKCKQLFKQKNSSADPEVLTQLEESLRARQDEQAIAKHLESSKPGDSPEALAELKKSVGEKREDYECYIQDFLPALKTEITNSKKLNLTEKTEIEKTIMKLITLDVVSKSSSVSSIPNAVEENIEDQMQLKHIEEQNNTQETSSNVAEKKSGDNKILSNSDVTEEVFKKYSKVVEEIEEKQTSKLSSDSGSDSGVSSREPSEENLELSVSSRRSSLTLVTSTSSEENVNSIPSVAEENNNLQKENENQMQPEQAVEEEPQVQESGNKAVLSKQEASNNENNSEDTPPTKQPNNRNLHVALVAGCALSTIGCIVAGAMTSGLVGAGLLAMAAVFAIAAVAELHSNFLSSKLTSINVEPLVDDKKLTACSHL